MKRGGHHNAPGVAEVLPVDELADQVQRLHAGDEEGDVSEYIQG